MNYFVVIMERVECAFNNNFEVLRVEPLKKQVEHPVISQTNKDSP